MIRRWRGYREWDSVNSAYWHHRLSHPNQPEDGCLTCAAYDDAIHGASDRGGWIFRLLWLRLGIRTHYSHRFLTD